MTFAGVTDSGRAVTGSQSQNFQSASGDILAVLFSVKSPSPTSLNISVSGAVEVADYARTGFGYFGGYSVGLKLLRCLGPATVTLNSSSAYSFAIAHYAGAAWSIPNLDTPLFWNDVPRGTPVTTPPLVGLFFAITGNTSWTAEYSWYPTFSCTTNFNRRNHDCFFTGAIVSGETVTITLNLLSKGDILFLPVGAHTRMATADATFV